MRIRQSIHISRPVDDVFEFVADHTNDHRWRSEVRSVQIVGAVREGVGTHRREMVAYQGKAVEANVEITEFEPGSRICFRIHGGMRAHGCYDFRAEGDGTRFGFSATVELTGKAAMLERYALQVVEKVVITDLKRLKAILEA